MIIRTAAQMRDLGARIARACRPGDVVVLTGELGAGKTTLVQGMGAALGIREPITSPTFVIARAHQGSGGHLLHVDAYRLGSAVELDDLDLDADVSSGITVVEWGEGHAERLAPDRLIVTIARVEDEARQVSLRAVGERWASADLAALETAA
ncbi:MAG: tRNA (adenosine(37)-N6)-threonylcarbamoyltransferase complex ATPase subunit type 1 TsaE [Actinomycetales bacterium]|nr:tRNA (adenosine(37)-N6)-threonylcarbamoyltransferase complex ATPase subunit type 1 TsaE [Actinomycetales bacterium]